VSKAGRVIALHRHSATPITSKRQLRGERARLYSQQAGPSTEPLHVAKVLKLPRPTSQLVATFRGQGRGLYLRARIDALQTSNASVTTAVTVRSTVAERRSSLAPLHQETLWIGQEPSRLLKHRSGCEWRLENGGLRTAACERLLANGGLRTAACERRLANGGLRTAACERRQHCSDVIVAPAALASSISSLVFAVTVAVQRRPLEPNKVACRCPRSCRWRHGAAKRL
jgi:hypothetical protein